MSKAIKCQKCGPGPCAYSRGVGVNFTSCLVLKREVAAKARVDFEGEFPVVFEEGGTFTAPLNFTGVRMTHAHTLLGIGGRGPSYD